MKAFSHNSALAQTARIRRAPRSLNWLRFVTAFAVLLTGCATSVSRTDPSLGSQSDARVGGAKDFLVVNCKIGGQVRQLGRSVTYLAPSRVIRTTAHDCEIQGGEYVLRSNRKTALQTWLPLAEQGDKVAQTYVGEIYEKGLGVPADYTLAAEWYRKAADQGATRAQNNLGFLYEKGLGVPKDPRISLDWYRRATGLTDPITLAPGTANELRTLRDQVEKRTQQLEEAFRQLERTQHELEALKRQSTAIQDDAAKRQALEQQLRERETELKQQRQRIERLEQEVRGSHTQVAREENKAAFATVDRALFGDYYALIIGNSDYQPPLSQLESPVRDARRLEQILKTQYGFMTTILVNATREQIIDTLSRFQKDLKDRDNLLIYYAGHGKLNSSGRGFWLPLDAKEDSPANWISNTDITDLLEVIKATHVLVVADSCYSGALTRGNPAELDPNISEGERITWLKTRAQKRSRRALTSGGLEPVLDTGGGDHSVFAKALLDALENNDQIVEAERIYREIAPTVRFKARLQSMEQAPEYGRITAAGDEYGEFFFVPAGTGSASYAYHQSR